MKSLLVLLCLLPAFGFAEIYRWVDENGKVHFADQPPEDNTATEEVSGSLEPINRDSSSSETEKLKHVFKGESPQDEAFRLNQENEQKRKDNAQQNACLKAKNELRKLKGRFVLIGKDGKEIVVSESEQQKMVEKLDRQIKRHCR